MTNIPSTHEERIPYTHVRTFLWVLVSLSLGIAFIIFIWLAVSTAQNAAAAKDVAQKIRDSQKTNTKTLDYSKRTLKLVNDCVTPGESCFDDGQERQGQIITTVTEQQREAAVYAAACADQPDEQTVSEIYTCVVKQQKKMHE